VPSYQLLSFGNDQLDETTIILYVTILLLIIVLIVIVFRDLTMSVSEYSYFALRNMPDKLGQFEPMSETLQEWQEHDEQSTFRKLRLPYSTESVNYFTFIALPVMIIGKIIWFFDIFEPDFDLSGGTYSDMTHIARTASQFSNFEGIMTLFLYASSVKYVMFWVNEVALLTEAMGEAWGKMKEFVFASALVLLGFAVVFHISWGTILYGFTKFDYSIASVL
jgi:hypothetical protein